MDLLKRAKALMLDNDHDLKELADQPTKEITKFLGAEQEPTPKQLQKVCREIAVSLFALTFQ